MVVALTGTLAFGAEVAVLRNGFEIRHERREQNGDTMRLYLDASDSSSYVEVPSTEVCEYRHDDSPPAPPNSVLPAAAPHAIEQTAKPDLHQIVNAASDKHQVDADLITSVIRAESNFNPRAVSPKGAQGLMQLMPGTASKLGVNDAFQPDANIDGGTRYLRDLLVQYNGDIAKALAAYNAGPHRVDQYKGVPPYRETHAYVARIIRDFNRKKRDQQKDARAAAAKKTSTRSAKNTAPAGPSSGSGETANR